MGRHAARADPGTGYRVLVFDTFNHYYVGIAMPQGSPLREPVNRALLKVMDTDDWLSLMERYVGPGG